MKDFATTDGELFVGSIERGELFTGGAHVDNTIMLSHSGCELGGLIWIRGIENGAAKDGAEHSKIFEGHLRRAILTDRDTGMGTDKANVGTRDGGHTNKVVGAREESGKGRGKGN